MMQADISKIFMHAGAAALIAGLLFFHLIGLRTVDQPQGLGLTTDWPVFALVVAAVFVLRFCLGFYQHRQGRAAAKEKAKPDHRLYTHILLALLAAVVILPFTPLASRYVLDVGTLIFTYIVLAYALNIVVGMTGLLDLGFVAFYALGAYSFALLAQYTGIDFWMALPLAALIAGFTAFLLGLTVMRLQGDYFAVVTLGFAEILRIVLLNEVTLTGGPNGINGIPRPTLLGLSFERAPAPGTPSFHEFFGLDFNSGARVVFLYYLVLLLAAFAFFITARLKRLPLGRAFEAVREDPLAAQAAGMNVTRIKLAAYVIAASIGALAGAFFAARQGFISPESFTFTESAMVLAIVVLGGIGHPLGIVLGALFLVGLPEIFRELQDYRLIAFGIGMVIIMLLRPDGIFSRRAPAVTFSK
jgi:branched-chain amino acid transport system permease protein